MTTNSEDPRQASGFGGSLGFGARPALLLVDFVRAYLEAGSPLYANVEQTREHCEALLGLARRTGIPVFHTRVAYRPGTADGGIFVRKLPFLREVFAVGSRLGEPAPGLESVAGESVITKQYASAFFGTPLPASLSALGIDTLLIAGVTTSGCVRASAVDACQYGYIPVVVRDCVGDRDPAPHEANLFDLQAKYADVRTLAEVRRYLEGLEALEGGPE